MIYRQEEEKMHGLREQRIFETNPNFENETLNCKSRKPLQDIMNELNEQTRMKPKGRKSDFSKNKVMPLNNSFACVEGQNNGD